MIQMIEQQPGIVKKSWEKINFFGREDYRELLLTIYMNRGDDDLKCAFVALNSIPEPFANRVVSQVLKDYMDEENGKEVDFSPFKIQCLDRIYNTLMFYYATPGDNGFSTHFEPMMLKTEEVDLVCKLAEKQLMAKVIDGCLRDVCASPEKYLSEIWPKVDNQTYYLYDDLWQSSYEVEQRCYGHGEEYTTHYDVTTGKITGQTHDLEYEIN